MTKREYEQMQKEKWGNGFFGNLNNPSKRFGYENEAKYNESNINQTKNNEIKEFNAPHDFIEAKNRLKEFSEKDASDFKLDTVKSKTWIFDHKVTGDELNSLVYDIQNYFIDINETNIKTIKEFGQVYKALESLDKEYMAGILSSIKAIEKTSNDVKKNQERIRKLVEDQAATLEILKSFKKKLDTYAHLGDIDKIWSDCQNWHNDIGYLSESIDNATSVGVENGYSIEKLNSALKITDERTFELSSKLSYQIKRLESIIDFTDGLKNIIHLEDIDCLWNISNEHTLELEKLRGANGEHALELDKLFNISEEIRSSVLQNSNSIEELAEYKAKLCSIAHLGDIDSMWQNTVEHSNKISELYTNAEEIRNLIHTTKELLDTAITGIREENNASLRSLSKKIKYSYIIAGGSLGAALIELILILFKVI